ncbi:hypothetical protein V9T40_001907 [Parthenolecanium corni]|uniref:DNA-directed DNA polymerase n=1 Tax=Parthenolecanium corni TaxID=536013 RepID=A0AAN9TJF9_9HEMI
MEFKNADDLKAHLLTIFGDNNDEQIVKSTIETLVNIKFPKPSPIPIIPPTQPAQSDAIPTRAVSDVVVEEVLAEMTASIPELNNVIDPPIETTAIVNNVNYELLLKDLELSFDNSDDKCEKLELTRGDGICREYVESNEPVVSPIFKKCKMVNLSLSESENEPEIDNPLVINQQNLDLVLKKISINLDLSVNDSSSEDDYFPKQKSVVKTKEAKLGDIFPFRYYFPKQKTTVKTKEVKLGDIFPFRYYFPKQKTAVKTKVFKKADFLPRLGYIFPFKKSFFKIETNDFPALGKIFPFHSEIYCDQKIYVGAGTKKVSNKIQNTQLRKKTAQLEPEPKIEELFSFDDDVIQPSKNKVELKYIQIREIGKRFIRKFNNHIIDYKINFKKNLHKLPQCDLVTKALDEMIEYTKNKTNWKFGDKMSILVENPKFFNPISTGYCCKDMTTKLKDKIMQIVTSDETVVLTDCLFTVHVVNMPRGASRRKIINLKKDRHTKKSILQINNTDNLCAPRAIITALTYHTNIILGRQLNVNDITYIRKGRPLQTDLAVQLCLEIGEYCEEGFTLDDIRSCEELLKVQVKIICAENFNNIIYKGRKECKTKLYLYKQGNHYDVITKMGAFYGASYYCEKCDKVFQNKDQHRCKKTVGQVCNMCMKAEHPKYKKDKIFCHVCNRYAFNQECLLDHGISVCAASFKCPKCSKIIKRSNFSKHKCGFTLCMNCKEVVEKKKHECFMLKKVPKGNVCGCKRCTPGSTKDNPKCTYTEKYIFFDYEARQETGVHKANLVVAKYFNGNTFTFKTNEEFCEWLVDRKHQNYTAIAHYARGYDAHFILQYLVVNTLRPHTIYNGTKLMLLEIKTLGLKIIDSHNFVAAPLSAFPKTFSLNEFKKGYFPHLFNTEVNENYVGSIPAKQYYCYDTMKEGDRNKFIEWHNKKVEEGYVFEMEKEIVEYCNSDVDILRRGCLDFRKQFLECENIDPFQYVTIASVCMAVYRHNYLKEKTIAVVEEDFEDKYSKQSILWLESFENTNIRHALNGGEVDVCGARVDGFDYDSKTVYQYHGCFWHGCPKCYSSEFINNIKHETAEDLLQKTQDRTKQLENAGYKVIEEWECKWIKTKEYKKLKKEKEIIEPLNPRDALFGGRTEVFQLKYAKKEKEENEEDIKNLTEEEELVGKYADVVSLYPSVMYYDYYPVGHPRKILRPAKHYEHWFGLIKCKVLAPKNLYIPVLPVRVKMDKAEKLVFPLCKKCAENQQPVCNHTDEERQFVGTWSTIEVNKAVERGYKVTDVYEVWDFEKSKDLWKGYISDFMKIKLETSPHNYSSNEEYAKDIEEKMGIKLDIDKIVSNPGKRAVAKLCLNSLWGKFGQRQNMSQTEFVTDAYRFYEILLDEKLQDINVMYVTDEMIQVNYKYRETFVKNNYNTNIFIALYTTANARLRLYDQLSRLDKYVMYCDTDSIVYLDNGKNTIPHGDMLGEWTDELDGGYIEKWIATGPKSYHYITNTGKTVTKVKGFTLHHKNALKINGEAMEKLIDSEIPCVTVTDNQITRDPETKQLGSVPFVKGSVPFVKGSVPFVKGSVPFVKGNVPFMEGSVPFVKGNVPFMEGSVPFVKGNVPFMEGSVPKIIIKATFNAMHFINQAIL